MKVKIHKKKSGAPAQITKGNISYHPVELYLNAELTGRDVVKICARRIKELQDRHYPKEWIERDLKKIVESR